MPAPHDIAAAFIARCRSGFANEFQHAAWLRKHAKEIAALPLEEREKVMFEHDQATYVGFSQRSSK